MKITQMTSEEIKIKVADMSYPFQSSHNHNYVLSWVGKEGLGGKEKRKKRGGGGKKIKQGNL